MIAVGQGNEQQVASGAFDEGGDGLTNSSPTLILRASRAAGRFDPIVARDRLSACVAVIR